MTVAAPGVDYQFGNGQRARDGIVSRQLAYGETRRLDLKAGPVDALAGDWVAAPGLFSEVSFASGREAGLAAATYVSRPAQQRFERYGFGTAFSLDSR